MRKLNSFQGVILGLAVSFICLDAGIVEAATPDIGGMEWTLDATFRMQVKKVGGGSDKRQVTLAIGPNDDYGLAEGEWKLIDSEAQVEVLEGTYHERPDSPGKGMFHFEPSNINEYLLAVLDDFAEEEDAFVTDLGNLTGRIDAKVKSGKKGMAISLTGGFATEASVDVQGTATTWRATFGLKAKGTASNDGQDPGPQGTEGAHWYFTTDNTLKVSGLGRLIDRGNADMVLGPNTEYDLEANEFVGLEEGVEVVRGQYSKAKNKYTFYGLEDLMSDIIVEYVEELFEQDDGVASYSDVQVNSIEVTATVVAKPGKPLKFDITVKFHGSAYVDGEYGEGQGTLTIKGQGQPILP